MIRTSWALALFHIAILIIISLRNDFAASFHDGCWSAKFLIVAGIIIAFLWVPNDPFFTGYLQVARVISVIFLMYQAMLILVVAYTLNDLLISNVEREGGGACTCSGIVLLVLFVIITGGNITWAIIQFIEFANEGCGANVVFLIITTVIGIGMYAMVFFRTRKDASMLTSAIVWSYQLYLQWSAMSSSPDPECNPYQDSTGNTTA